MKCPNCNMPVKRGSLCINCGVDAVLFTKTVQLSDALYNKGLSEAKSGNLSLAIESLNKSVSFNKNNNAARNLLGLVYFEYGRVTDALKHWIISVSLDKEDNPAEKYIAKIQEDTRAFERLGEAIDNYNNALSYIKQKSEDMAIIQLKKAIELNPGFVDALNLLALCFLILKDKDRALSAVEKALSIDNSNPVALNYYKEIHPNRNRLEIIKKESRSASVVERQKTPSTPYLYAKPKKSIISAFHLASILLFIVGVACTFAYFSILVLPPMMEESKAEVEALKQSITEVTQTNEQKLKEKDEEYESLQSQVQKLASEKDDLSAQLVRQEKIQKVSTAYNFQRENRLDEAADILYSLDVTGLPVDTVELYDTMVDTSVYPKVVLDAYNKGVSAYNAKKYEEAKLLLERGMRFVAEGAGNKPNIIYYLGLTAQALENFDEAIEYYTDLVENYPESSSNIRNNAQSRLNSLIDQ